MVCWAERERLPALPGPALVVLMFRSRYLLSGEWRVDILRSVGPGAGPEEAGADNIPYHLLKGQAVLFVHRHEERREHDPQHEEHGPGPADRPTGQQIDGDPHQPAASETNELPLGEVERQLGLDPGQVIGDIHIGYGKSLLSVPRPSGLVVASSTSLASASGESSLVSLLLLSPQNP